MNSIWVRTWGAVFLITASVWICYFHTLDVPMLFDDVHNIVENSNIQIEKLSFNSLYAAAFENPTPRPVAYLTLATNYYLGGLDVSGYHVVNILIHCLNGVIVFWLFQFLTPRICNVESDDTNGQLEHWWIPLAAALLFVVHPVQTQSVTYIVQRMASLCATFYLAGLLTFLWGRTASNNSKRNLFWLISLGCWVWL